jgi:hypothetical protein
MKFNLIYSILSYSDLFRFRLISFITDIGLSPFMHFCKKCYLSVSELVGWVRNVVLIKCIFGSGKPRGVGILGGRVYEPGEEQGS